MSTPVTGTAVAIALTLLAAAAVAEPPKCLPNCAGADLRGADLTGPT